MADTHIKINAVTPRVQYTGNGVTTTFPYEFAIFDETDMVVYVGDDIIESGYTVTGAGETEGGTVVFDTAPDDGAKITLLRNVPIERITDFQEGGTFRPKNLNDEFDRQTAFVQQVQETLDRAVKVGPTSDVEPEQVLTQVERVYDSIDNVDAVSDDLTNIDAVAADLTNIDAVASDLSNVDTVAGIASDVSNVASNSSDVSNVATNMSDVNNCATNMAAILDAPTQAQAAADSAALSAQYANDKINQTHITNCITDIPQDIKLERNNSTLTLKAGSTVYVPNGNGVFEKKTTTSDLSKNTSGDSLATGTYMLFVNSALSRIDVWPLDKVVSGSTDSLSGTTFHTWYDTTNNVINRYTNSGSTVNWTCALPLAIVTITNSFVTSIDQVFNGFGYIGSTVYALPGVKGLIPNGRNADGTLKSAEFTVSSVRTVNTNSGTKNITLVPVGINIIAGYYETETQPSEYYSLWYKPSENISYDIGTGTINATTQVQCCSVSCDSNGKITSFTSKTVFHALDYNDKSIISGWGMPSNNRLTLTIGANNTTYTAPANGYFSFFIATDAAADYLYGLKNITTEVTSSVRIANVGQAASVFIPAKKGDIIMLTREGAVKNTSNLWFIYAEGEV